MNDDLNIEQIPEEIDFDFVCQKMGYTYPPVNTEGIEYLIIDEYTAIPFMLIESS